MKPVEMLIVEDNWGDVVLIKEAMKEAGLSYNVTVANDGVEAMEFLHRSGKYSEVPRPDLIVLDLKLPRKNGREVFDEIKPDPELSKIPLIFLSSSKSELEIARAYGLPAECYIAKPGTFDGYINLVKAIDAFRQKATKEKS